MSIEWKNKIKLIGNELYFPACWIYDCEEGPTTAKPIGYGGNLLEYLSWEIAPSVGEASENVLEYLQELCINQADETEDGE